MPRKHRFASLVIQPGGVSTNFTNVEEQLFDQGEQNSPHATFRENVLKTLRQGGGSNRLTLNPEQVARVIFEAASTARPRKRYRVGLLAKMLPRLHQLLPEFVWDRFVVSLYSID